MKFKDYIEDWFKKELGSHKNDKQWLQKVSQRMNIEDIEDLQDVNDVQIYSAFFSYNTDSKELVDIDTVDLLISIFSKVLKKKQLDYDFIGEFVRITANHCADYDYPTGFFKDLNYGGCASGLIGEFVYNNDCREFYVKHIDSLEDYARHIKYEFDGLKEDDDLPHYTYIVWLCYEDFAYRLANKLWPDKF